jgi:stearoyl-CoA desaturase (Delta-9 desaturase)
MVGRVEDMTRAERTANLVAVVLPFVAFIAAIVLLWNSYVGVTDLVAFGAMYLIAGFGVTVGFHRLLTHRSFQTHKAVEYAFAIAGSMSVQGPVADWVADHRKHHAHADEEGDPHSPHLQFGEGWMGALKGLFHAHMGWLFTEHGQAERRKYAKDLVEDRGMRKISRRFHWWVLLGLAIPFVFGLAVSGTLKGGLTALLWGGFVRIFLQHHVTWSINSVCHFFGRRRFDVEDESTNVFWLALPSLGEAWHHNHHAFPRSARHGLRWYEIDLSAALIALLQKLGLAWNVTKIAPERQAQKLAGAARVASAAGD